MLNNPSLINNFNIYDVGDALVGISGQVELPELAAMTETLSGAGIAGEIEDPATGAFSSMTVTIPFAVLYGDHSIYSIAHQNDAIQLTLRADEQILRGDNGITDHKSARYVFRGRAKTVTNGNAEVGKKQDASVEIELNYLKVEYDGVEQLELDKLNMVYKVLGVDQLAVVRANC